MSIKKQNVQYIDSNIQKVFHFLELRANQAFLIGSNTIRNVLYKNDYDLNENINITDSITILNKLYKEFKAIFTKAYKHKDYYILDFKNGYDNKHQPIRWSYDDIKKGSKTINKRNYLFTECLLQENNIIKLDLCYVHNNLFTDVNIVYNLILKHDPKRPKESLMQEIKEAVKDKDYYKVIKRKFNLALLKGKIDQDILNIMNSHYGILYKFINSLQLVNEMLVQTFKPISMEIVKINLEYIKQFASNIIIQNFDKYINELIDIIDMKNSVLMQIRLEKYIKKLEKFFNNLLKQKISYKIIGGKMKVNTLHKMLNNSYEKKHKQHNHLDGYTLDKHLSGDRAQVYYNHDTNHLVVAHRGTKGIHDVITDMKLMLGMKNNKRFKHGKKITDDAIKKYDTDNISVIGHSLGHSLAKEANKKHNAELITLNGATTPLDMFNKQKDNEYMIRTANDPVSYLHSLNPYRNKQNTITINSKSYNPLREHTVDTLDRLDEDEEIGL